MEYTMKMPACFNVMTEEEMTYTEGGATLTSLAEAALNWIPLVGWYEGIMAVRSYRKANPDTWIDTGLKAVSNKLSQSAESMVRTLGRIVWVGASCATGAGLIVNAAIVLR